MARTATSNACSSLHFTGLSSLPGTSSVRLSSKNENEREIVFFVHEAFNLWWQAFLDDRALLPLDDINPAWHGYSTATWDGDALVVESRGFNGKVWLDQLGKPSTEALHVTLRFHRKDFGHMDIGITIDDPKAYTRPWGTTVEARLNPNTELMEAICGENEKDTRKR